MRQTLVKQRTKVSLENHLHSAINGRISDYRINSIRKSKHSNRIVATVEANCCGKKVILIGIGFTVEKSANEVVSMYKRFIDRNARPFNLHNSEKLLAVCLK